MQTLRTLFDYASGAHLPEADVTPSRRGQLALIAIGTAIAMSAVWGAAAGSTVLPLALQNLYKVPLIVLLSTLGALPVALLSWKLIRVDRPARELLLGYASSVFLGCSVLLVLAPLVALYYHSSQYGGPWVAMASVALGLIVGTGTFVRTMIANHKQAARPVHKVWVPAGVLVIVYAMTLSQLVAQFSPILPEETVFDLGADALELGR